MKQMKKKICMMIKYTKPSQDPSSRWCMCWLLFQGLFGIFISKNTKQHLIKTKTLTTSFDCAVIKNFLKTNRLQLKIHRKSDVCMHYPPSTYPYQSKNDIKTHTFTQNSEQIREKQWQQRQKAHESSEFLYILY